MEIESKVYVMMSHL